jgi:two-component system sensor histidine kinase PilS (NtrC family)
MAWALESDGSGSPAPSGATIGPELRRNLARMIGVRAIIGTLLLGGATLAEISAPGLRALDPFFFLIALTYLLTILYAATLRLAGRHRWLVDLQLGGDALIVSAFVYLTGGIASFFSFLYVLPIVAASTVQSRRGSLLVATLSGVLYFGMVAMQYLAASGVLDARIAPDSSLLPPNAIAQYTVALNLFGLFAVALISGSLAERLRSSNARLQRASTEIADLQALSQHVINSLRSGLVTTDMSKRVLTFNHAAELITGEPLASVVGRPVAEVLQLPDSMAAILDQERVDQAQRLESRYRRRNGTEIDLGLSVSHLETPGGRAGHLMTFQDLTEVKKAEREALRHQRLAAVGEMAAGIAHEIRNPLASMSGSIQLLRQELPLSPDQEQLMDIVLRESERLNSTIRSFLAYARPQRLALARFDVRRALNDTALLLRHSLEVGKGHAIEVDVPDAELWYEADEGQIRQVVWNLATNGLRAMPGGGRLRLAARRNPSGEIVISVCDQGVGIPPGEIDGLFQPFHGHFGRGSGLGLAIVHRIVTDYHGRVEVISPPGAGTTFAVRLPALEAVTA